MIRVECCNCNGPHAANFAECPKLIEYLDSIEKRKSNKKQSTQTQPNKFVSNYIRPNIQYSQVAALRNSQTNPTPIAQTVDGPNKVVNNQTDAFSLLNSEIEELNKICNLEKMIQIVRNLKAELINAKSDIERIRIFDKYSQTSNG